MSKYTVIADVGEALVDLLQLRMVPELFLSKEQIGLCMPKEPGDYRLGVCLYDIRESDSMRNASPFFQGENVRVFPPIYLDLYYMLVPFPKSDWNYQAVEEQRILGKVIQILRDDPILNRFPDSDEAKKPEPAIVIEILDLDYENKSKIWNSFYEAGRNAVYCKIGPIALEANRKQPITRVREVDVLLKRKER